VDRGRVSTSLAGEDTGKGCGLFFDGNWENGQRGVQLGEGGGKADVVEEFVLG